MAVTKAYSLVHVADAALGQARSSLDVTGLADGGFAGLGNHATNTDVSFFDPSGVQIGPSVALFGTNGALAQLNDGNVVVALQDSNSIRYWILNTSGEVVTSAVDINDADSINADVLALAGGGFWIINEDELAGGPGGDCDIVVHRYNNAGTQQGAAITVSGSSARDTGASVAQLDGGNIAVAWTRTVGAETEIWIAVYDADGAVVTAAKKFDDDGSINANVSLAPTAGGGFALVYEDNGLGAGGRDITLALLNSTGGLISTRDITDPTGAGDGSEDVNPSIARLTNGVLAISYGFNGGANTIVRVDLFDPTTGSITFGANITGPRAVGNDVDNAVLAAFGQNRVVGVGVDSTVGDVVGDAWELTRTSTGDNANDTILGDNLIDIMLGGGGNDTLTGMESNDALSGDAGLDLLDGGVGADVMNGGDGNDTYIVDNSGDVVVEDSASGGIDLVKSSVTRTLGANFENLTLTGTGAINGTGNELANALTGNGKANVLDGRAGADTMKGGGGDDTYVVDNVGDVTTEFKSAGMDLVKSSVTRTLGVNLENLTLTGTAAINGTGNELVNAIIGNSKANILDGRAGTDTMKGGGGNDTYIVDNAGDVTTEFQSAGVDLVKSSVTRTLGVNIENLTLTGASAINGTGNAQVNTLTGNAKNNVLDGASGADTMIGGGGNDTYIVDSAGDVTTEFQSAGTDLVKSSVTRVLGVNLENLTLTGAAAINGTGNTLANAILGNDAANVLDGGAGNDKLNGGLGADTLTGGADSDTFVFSAALGATNIDRIMDFDAAADTIHLDNAVFTGLLNGALSAGAFVVGSAALDADDRIVYDATTGALYFDADGAGGAAQVQFATLTTHPTITAADFVVI